LHADEAGAWRMAKFKEMKRLQKKGHEKHNVKGLLALALPA